MCLSTQITIRVGSSRVPLLDAVYPKLRLRGPSPRAFGARDDRLERAAKVLEAIQTLFDYVEARGVAEPNGAVVAEGSSRNDGHAGFAQ